MMRARFWSLLVFAWITTTNALRRGLVRAAATRRSILYLNRIFVDADEVKSDRTISLAKDDPRSKHISSILKLRSGDTIKLGVVDEGKTDNGRVVSVEEEDGSFVLSLGEGELNKDRVEPCVDLLLACPRPLRLERLLPVVACMGVTRLVLLDAEKVEKDFFGSHLFRRPAEVRAGFIEGLSQAASDFVLPTLLVRRRLLHFITEELDTLFPSDVYKRVIAHPSAAPGAAQGSLTRLSRDGPDQRKMVVAVGPEGGWTDAEVQLFLGRGFAPVSLGDRILRTDMAVPALLSLAREWTSSSSV
jgi:16S rRNA U1498 N3-methylase RsmE